LIARAVEDGRPAAHARDLGGRRHDLAAVLLRCADCILQLRDGDVVADHIADALATPAEAAAGAFRGPEQPVAGKALHLAELPAGHRLVKALCTVEIIRGELDMGDLTGCHGTPPFAGLLVIILSTIRLPGIRHRVAAR